MFTWYRIQTYLCCGHFSWSMEQCGSKLDWWLESRAKDVVSWRFHVTRSVSLDYVPKVPTYLTLYTARLERFEETPSW